MKDGPEKGTSVAVGCTMYYNCTDVHAEALGEPGVLLLSSFCMAGTSSVSPGPNLLLQLGRT